jgi:hypothetical protein
LWLALCAMRRTGVARGQRAGVDPPSQPHSILVGDVPFLAFYCWTRDVNELAKVLPSRDWPQIED